MNTTEILNWRYATKQMTGSIVSNEKLNTILESIRMAPTSFGLQLFKVFVVENIELKKKLSSATWNQPQIEQCSHLLVFAVPTKFEDKLINDFILLVSKERNIPIDNLNNYSKVIKSFIENMTEEYRIEWFKKQVYIALGFALLVCADEKVDSTPMEGFVANKYDEILDLNSKGLTTTVILPLGYRDKQKDKSISDKKIRKSKEDLFEFI